MSVSAVILCSRMNSSRLPGKAMIDLCGTPLIGHVLKACKAIEGIDRIIVAVPDKPENTPIVDYAESIGCTSFLWAGDENDVLGRMKSAAAKHRCDQIVRVTHDCPLLDPHVCSAVLDVVKRNQADYASNVMPRTYEKGLDCEAFSRWALELTAREATDAYDREHVTPPMQRSTILRRINIESGEPERAARNLCVDYPGDLDHIRFVMEMRGLAA